MEPKVSDYLHQFGIEVPAHLVQETPKITGSNPRLLESTYINDGNYRAVLDVLTQVVNHPDFRSATIEVKQAIFDSLAFVDHKWFPAHIPYVLAANEIMRQSNYYKTMPQAAQFEYFLAHFADKTGHSLVALLQQGKGLHTPDYFVWDGNFSNSLCFYLEEKGFLTLDRANPTQFTLQPEMLESLIAHKVLPFLVQGIIEKTNAFGDERALYQRFYELTGDEALGHFIESQNIRTLLAKGDYEKLTQDPATQLPQTIHLDDKQMIEFATDHIFYRHAEATETVLVIIGDDHNGAFTKAGLDIRNLQESSYNVVVIDDRYTPGLTLDKIREAITHSGQASAIDKIMIDMHGGNVLSMASRDTSLGLSIRVDVNARELLKLLVHELSDEENSPLSIALGSCHGQLAHNHVADILPAGSTFITFTEDHYFAGQTLRTNEAISKLITHPLSGQVDWLRLASQGLYDSHNTNGATVTVTNIGLCKSRPIVTMHKSEFAKVIDALSQEQITSEVADYICENDQRCIKDVQGRFQALAPVLTQEEYPLLSIRAAEGKLPHGQDIALAMYQLYGPCNATSLHLIAEPEQVYTQTPNPLLMAMEPAIQWGMYIPGIEAIPDMLGW